jgi:hypothetical protein
MNPLLNSNLFLHGDLSAEIQRRRNCRWRRCLSGRRTGRSRIFQCQTNCLKENPSVVADKPKGLLDPTLQPQSQSRSGRDFEARHYFITPLLEHCALSESRTITKRMMALLVSVTRPPPLRLKLCRYEKNTYRAFGVVCGTNVLPKTSRCGGCSGLQRTWILCSRLFWGPGGYAYYAHPYWHRRSWWHGHWRYQ